MTEPTQAHFERDHAQWSASATARNWTCAGAIAMSTMADAEVESIHAARGTAAHEISEKCLRDPNKPPLAFLGSAVQTKAHKVVIDDELVRSAEMYVDYVRGLSADRLLIEQKLSLADLNPPFEAGGTCDAIALFLKQRLMEVIDLKNGMGIVEVNGNKQTRSYALTALLNIVALLNIAAAAIDQIKVTIVQPRAPHEDGRVRSETFHVADLLEWAVDLLAAMQRARVAFDAFKTLNGGRAEFEAWAETYLTPGACTFCPAERICPALRKKALSIIPNQAAAWFENPDGPTPTLTNLPALLTDQEIETLLDGLDMLDAWADAVRGLAHQRAERGTKYERWQLVEKIGRRAYVEKDDAKLATLIREKLNLTDAQIYEKPEVKSLAQLEKVGKDVKSGLAKLEGVLWHKPVTGTNLVRKETTERPAVGSVAERFFESPTGDK